MIKNIYGIYDAKAKKFATILVHDNELNLKRDLTVVVNSGDRNNYLATCTSDFALHLIGSIDDETGQVIPKNHEIICELISLKEKEN